MKHIFVLSLALVIAMALMGCGTANGYGARYNATPTATSTPTTAAPAAVVNTPTPVAPVNTPTPNIVVVTPTPVVVVATSTPAPTQVLAPTAAPIPPTPTVAPTVAPTAVPPTAVPPTAQPTPNAANPQIGGVSPNTNGLGSTGVQGNGNQTVNINLFPGAPQPGQPGYGATNAAPNAAPNTNPNASTNCAVAETKTTGKGTEADPLIYPQDYLHDLCWASAGNGSGTKFIDAYGPLALQMGEGSGTTRMVYVKSGLHYRGWTQGGWRYATDAALLAQWFPENVANNRFGLICGYERNMGLGHLPTFSWNGTKEVKDTELECPLTATAGTTAAPAKFDGELYPRIVKYRVGTTFVCAAVAKGASLPTVDKLIEDNAKGAGDGNYLHDNGTYGMHAYCSDDPVAKHGAPSGTVWTTGLIKTGATFVPVQFPLR